MNYSYDDFFEAPPPKHFEFLQPINPPWDLPGRIAETIRLCFERLDNATPESAYAANYDINLTAREPEMVITRSFQLKEPLLITKPAIYIDSGCSLEVGAVIRGGTVIGKDSEVRQAAYIRGGALIGEACVVGHATEVKNAALVHHVECGHFNYIGDSIIGSFVNIGAGSILSNLNFRTYAQKKAGEFPVMRVNDRHGKRFAGPSKFGSIIGDGTEVGCNSVMAPGSFIGKNCRIFPCVFLFPGFYKPGTSVLENAPNIIDKKYD